MRGLRSRDNTAGRFVVLVGPDGVGKTTVARELLSRHDGPTGYVHFRPRLGTPLQALPGDDAPLPKVTTPGPMLLGWVRLVRNIALFWLGYLKWVRPAVREGALVVADRWGYGYVGQPMSLRFAGPQWLAALAVRLLPRPDLVVRLTTSAATILSRKQELSEEEIAEELRRWRELPVRPLLDVGADVSPSAIAVQIEKALVMPKSHKGFPPWRPFIGVPTSSRAAAKAALILHAPSRPSAMGAQTATRAWLTVAGARSLPFPSIDFFTAVDADVWFDLRVVLAEQVGRFDEVGFARRRQQERGGAALLLLRSGEPVAFVKVTHDDHATLEHEHEAVRTVFRSRPSAFRIPRPIALGSVAGVHYLVLESVPAPHRPARDVDLDPVLRDIQTGLRASKRPTDVPPHWEPMHGDLAPWNLRLSRSSLYLLDWEQAGWGPPDADRAYYEAASAALWGGSVTARREARDFWIERIERRSSVKDAIEDRRLSQSLIAFLQVRS